MLVVETAVGRQLVARGRDLGYQLDELATQLGVPPAVVTDLMRGSVPLTDELAARLADGLGGSVGFWLELDTARRRDAWLAELDNFSPLTLKELRRRGFVTATKARRDVLAGELADFFDCDPSEATTSTRASFRQSQAHPVREDAVSVWLRLAGQQADRAAEARDVQQVDLPALRALLPTLARVGRRAPEAYLPEVTEQLANVGVVLVFQADVPGTRLSGASWPAPSRGHGVVALTLRHAKDDFFWWTLFHECAHLLLEHGVVVDAVHDGGQDDERAADDLGRALLLPESWDVGLGRPSRNKLVQLAAVLQVPVGVLVGQLHHRGTVPQQNLKDLKVTMPAAETVELPTELPRPHGAAWEAAVAELVRASSAR